jgi:cytochrome c553
MQMRTLLLALLVSAACGKNTEPPPPSSGSPNAQPESGPKDKAPAGGGSAAMAPADQARQMFNTVCATCHGANGDGNGPAAANLTPKPRNYTDAAWQASVTDDYLHQVILKGGQAMGKSALMPAQPQLEAQPAVLDELVKIIRSFKK